MWVTIGSSTLYFTQGTSDKFYEVRVQFDEDARMTLDGFRVQAGYGRRGCGSYNRSTKGTFRDVERATAMAAGILHTKYTKGYTAHRDGRTPLNDSVVFRRRVLDGYDDARGRQARLGGADERLRRVNEDPVMQAFVPQEHLPPGSRERSQSDIEENRVTEAARQARLALAREERRLATLQLARERALQNPEYDIVPRVIDMGEVD